MKLYLSSYKIGNRGETLLRLAGGRTLGYVPNALDYTDAASRAESNERNLTDLRDFGLRVELLDLGDYFGKPKALKERIDGLGGVWVRGGNTFVLRQAMKLSGFDDIIAGIARMEGNDFLYGGYSAGICVLAPDLTALQLVDDPNVLPYEGSRETVWEGLGLLDYVILPHYKSAHPEAGDIDREVAYCERNRIPYKTLRDGEVILIE